MTAHSKFGPSGAHRWLACPGSIKAEDGYPDTQSDYAEEGTSAHALAEKCLTTGKDASFYNKGEMAGYVQQYVDYVRSLGGKQEYEQEVSYNEWVLGGFGTADAVVINGDVLHVVDLKYGKGVKVDAEENPQGMLYALGALFERDSFQTFNTVVIVIHQPRLNHVSEWETTPARIYEFGKYAKKRALLCKKPDAQRIPGEKQCKFCRAKATCPELLTLTNASLLSQFDSTETVSLKNPTDLTFQQISTVLTNKPIILDWLRSVEDYVANQIQSGTPFPGWKMVHGRSNRKWADEKEAEQVLLSLVGENAYIKKLLTAPAAEKLLGKENKDTIQHLIEKPDGAPVLVPEEDKRPAISFVTADDF